MRFQPAAIALVAVLVTLAAPVTAVSPKDVGASQIFLELNWTMDFGESLPPQFSLTTFGFPDNAWQTARFEPGPGHPFTTSTDERGNTIVEYTFKPTQQREQVSLRAFIDVNYVAEPQPGVPGDFANFTPLTEASPAIRAEAVRIMGQTNDTLERATLVTAWVNNHVSYDGVGYGAVVDNASSVYETRHGTCDEYAHLAASLLRVANIPVKFVAGFVCSTNCETSDSWGPHAWIEVLADGKWYPFDPTFNEGIVLDATHVKFAEGRDQSDIRERLHALAYDYPISNIKFDRSSKINLDTNRPFGPIALVAINATNDVVGEAAIAQVTATAKSTYARPLALPLSITAPVELAIPTANSTLVLLQPGESRDFSWNLLFPQSLDAGFVYKYPIRVDTLGQSASINLTGKKGGAYAPVSGISIVQANPVVTNGVLELSLVVTNTGNIAIRDAPVSFDTPYGTAKASLNAEPGQDSSIKLVIPLNGTDDTQITGTLTIGVSPPLVQKYSITLPTPQPPTPQADIALSFDPALPAAIAIVIILILALYLYKH